MYVITITSKDGKRKILRPSDAFGKDSRGERLTPAAVQELARDIAWDTFGRQVASVECIKPKHVS
jgi:hypothetical protein